MTVAPHSCGQRAYSRNRLAETDAECEGSADCRAHGLSLPRLDSFPRRLRAAPRRSTPCSHCNTFLLESEPPITVL